VRGADVGSQELNDRERLAQDVGTPAATVLELAHDPDPAVRRIVAARAEVPSAIVGRLAKDPEPAVRAALAANADVAPRVLERLAGRKHVSPDVQRALASNPASSPRVLKRVVRRGRWDVQMRALVHPACPVSVVRRLARDGAWAVRATLARDPRTPADILDRFATDVRPVRLALAANPAASPATMMLLLGEGDEYVRGVAAANPAAPPGGLVALAAGLTEPSWTLRNIARNPACPPDLSEEVLTWLALGGSGRGNPTFDPDRCFGHPGDPEISQWYWYREAATADRTPETHSLWRVRHMVATQDRVPYPALELLARDPQLEVRRAVARFDTLSITLLDEMCGDEDEVVARLARTTLERKQAGLRQRPVHKRVSTVRAGLVALGVVALVLLALAVRDDGKGDDTVGVRALDVPALVGGGAAPPFVGATTVTDLPGGGHLTVGLVVTGDGVDDTLGLYFQGGTTSITVTGVSLEGAEGDLTPLDAIFTLDAGGTEEVTWPHFTGVATHVRLQVGGEVQDVVVRLPGAEPAPEMRE